MDGIYTEKAVEDPLLVSGAMPQPVSPTSTRNRGNGEPSAVLHHPFHGSGPHRTGAGQGYPQGQGSAGTAEFEGIAHQIVEHLQQQIPLPSTSGRSFGASS